jgi:hypothetical protein
MALPAAEPSLGGSGAAFGGVREDRLGGGSGLGNIRRVTMPWPTVQRFVVTQ